MSHVKDILARWDKPADLAGDLGRPYTTVKGWWDCGRVPYRDWPSVASAAQARGWAVSPRDLFEAHERDRLALKQAGAA